MAPLHPVASSSLSLPPNSYIYKITSTASRQDPLNYLSTDSLAVIASDDSLRLIDPSTLQVLPDGVIKGVNESVTCLERVDDQPGNIVATAGRDGFIRLWDKRTQLRAMFVQTPNSKPVSSIVCSQSRNTIVAGVEQPQDGPGEAPITIWDTRFAQKPQLELLESHTDTITDLQLHPNLPDLLLSASTDGLINIFDIKKPDEEEALYQVINHRSAVHHAGFLYPSTEIYALGTDETLSFYALQDPDETKEEPQPNHFGDVRGKLEAEYMVKMHWIGDEPYIAAGSYSNQYLDIIPLEKAPAAAPLDWRYDLSKSARLRGAHGEEIVRDMFSDVHSSTTFTVGEDGNIRAWKFAADEDAMEIDEGKKAKSKKEKRKGDREEKECKKGRFKPY